MQMLGDDDLNLKEMTDEELAAAWDLWFDIAQTTNEADPPFTHGVFVNLTWRALGGAMGIDDKPELPPTNDTDGRGT